MFQKLIYYRRRIFEKSENEKGDAIEQSFTLNTNTYNWKEQCPPPLQYLTDRALDDSEGSSPVHTVNISC